MQVATGLQAGGQLGNQWRLNQPALVVFGLVPRVWKKDVRAVQAGQWQHVVDDFDRIMLQDADVAELLLINALEQCANARRMNLAAKKVFLKHHGGNVCGCLAHAKADFEHSGCRALKGSIKVHVRGVISQQKFRPDIGEGFGLAQSGSASTANKAADGSVVTHVT